MDRKELEAKVIELVEISYGKAAGEVTLETSFKDDLKGASVQMVALVSEIENELDAMVALQDASACETVKDLVDKVEEELSNRGRILVRPSGTEPLIRVMLEGEDYSEISEHANVVADLIRERLS